MIGISTPCVRARSSTGPADFAPSATWVVIAATSATGMPRPIISPNVRFRDSGELQVATRSPIPASPAKVCWSAPSAAPSRVISARPRVISVARVLSPQPMPTAMPTPSAMTFFTAPPSSQPITSGFVYGRK